MAAALSKSERATAKKHGCINGDCIDLKTWLSADDYVRNILMFDELHLTKEGSWGSINERISCRRVQHVRESFVGASLETAASGRLSSRPHR